MKAQQSLKFRTLGGRRKGAGRPSRDGKAGVSHLTRPEFPGRLPLHVTLRMTRAVWSLRSQRCFRLLKSAFYWSSAKTDFRVVHYSVQGNHIHLLVEAEGKLALTRGMRALGIRIAKTLNRLMG